MPPLFCPPSAMRGGKRRMFIYSISPISFSPRFYCLVWRVSFPICLWRDAAKKMGFQMPHNALRLFVLQLPRRIARRCWENGHTSNPSRQRGDSFRALQKECDQKRIKKICSMPNKIIISRNYASGS